MKKLTVLSSCICIALLSYQTTAIAADSPASSATTSQRLILALNIKELARHLNRTDTYTAQYGNSKNIETASFSKQTDAVTKNLKKASKAFKRFTSVRYGKGQKIRAKIGKSSLTLKYTRAL